MTTLKLRVDKYLEGQRRAPEIYASIIAISSSGSRDKSKPVVQALIPVSHKKEVTKNLEVNPGRYYVEATLPSGEFLSDDVIVKEGQTESIVLKAEDSPHEWLSWQQIAGNVQAARPAEKRKPRTAATGSRAKVDGSRTKRSTSKISTLKKSTVGVAELGGSRKSGGGVAGRPYSAGTISSSTVREVDVRRPLDWLPHVDSSLVSNEQGGVWKWLSEVALRPPGPLIRALNGGRPTRLIKPAAFDQEHGVFRISSKKGPGVVVLPGREKLGKRTYIAIQRRSCIELLLLPLPWPVLRTNRHADIEIVKQQPADPSGFCSSAIARDEEFGMLLGYLSSGSLPTVRRIAETAKDMLYYKHSNPFAAVAGAYALVGTAKQTNKKEWHQWVFNLMDRFPYIPDGAIQWGRLMMRMRRNSDDIAEARKAFKQAYRRGLPYYSLGMRWLLEGLEWCSDNDSEAKDMAYHVRLIAWTTNYQQPFTTLLIGGRANV